VELRDLFFAQDPFARHGFILVRFRPARCQRRAHRLLVTEIRLLVVQYNTIPAGKV
jgi:hypothetical protein